MLNIFLIRHGETAWNADNNRYTGRTDLPLTEKGLQQAEALRQQLSKISLDAVYSSPLQRAYTTAQIATGIDPTKDDRLIEIDWGMWEGKSKETFVAEHPALWNDWMPVTTTTRCSFAAPRPTISTDAPLPSTPRMTRPVTTVPRPSIVKTSSIGMRNGDS